MSYYREVISLAVGSCGISTTDVVFQSYCLDFGIDEKGKLINKELEENDPRKNRVLEIMFDEVKIPRLIFIDCEEESGFKVKNNSPIKNIYCDDNFYCPNEKSKVPSLIYSRGLEIGNKYKNEIFDSIRKYSEKCERLQGFMIYNSTGGGTSGMLTSILKLLVDEYGRKAKISFSINPDYKDSPSMFGNYNQILSYDQLTNLCDIVFPFDNEAIKNICRCKLYIDKPSFQDMNEIFSFVNSCITQPLRFDDALTFTDMWDFEMRFARLYPRIHFIIPSISPIYSKGENKKKMFSNFIEVSKSLVEPENQLCCVDLKKGKSIASKFHVFGNDLEPKNVMDSFREFMKNYNVVTWNLYGNKCSLSNRFSSVIGDKMQKDVDTCLLLSNHTCFGEILKRVHSKFELDYKKKRFMHWYLGECVKEKDFEDANTNIKELIRDFEELQIEVEETDDDEFENENSGED